MKYRGLVVSGISMFILFAILIWFSNFGSNPNPPEFKLRTIDGYQVINSELSMYIHLTEGYGKCVVDTYSRKKDGNWRMVSDGCWRNTGFDELWKFVNEMDSVSTIGKVSIVGLDGWVIHVHDGPDKMKQSVLRSGKKKEVSDQWNRLVVNMLDTLTNKTSRTVERLPMTWSDVVME